MQLTKHDCVILVLQGSIPHSLSEHLNYNYIFCDIECWLRKCLVMDPASPARRPLPRISRSTRCQQSCKAAKRKQHNSIISIGCARPTEPIDAGGEYIRMRCCGPSAVVAAFMDDMSELVSSATLRAPHLCTTRMHELCPWLFIRSEAAGANTIRRKKANVQGHSQMVLVSLQAFYLCRKKAHVRVSNREVGFTQLD